MLPWWRSVLLAAALAAALLPLAAPRAPQKQQLREQQAGGGGAAAAAGAGGAAGTQLPRGAACELLWPAAAGPTGPSCRVLHAKEDCGDAGIQQPECERAGCCWQPAADAGTPWCFRPQAPSSAGYRVAQRRDSGARSDLLLQLDEGVLPEYGPDFGQLAVAVELQTPQRLRARITPPATPGSAPRWEVPESLIPRPNATEFDPCAALYLVELPREGEAFSLAVGRSSQPWQHAGRQDELLRPVFNTSGFSLVFKDQYIELTTSLEPTAELYGLGETVQASGALKLPRDGATITLWAFDTASANPGVNLYGAHPFYLQVSSDGLASGVFLLNSNGMDVVLQRDSLSYRVLGGVLDLYFFLGPSPEDVIRQYQEVIGRPAMPPYWALGFHQSRWGYGSLAELEAVVAGYEAAGIPLEVVWADIDLLDRHRDFTVDPERFGLAQTRAFVDRLHAAGRRFVPIFDCGIPAAPDDPAYVSGSAAGVWLRGADGQPYLGQVWPGPTHWPDFLATNTTWPWWRDQFARFHEMARRQAASAAAVLLLLLPSCWRACQSERCSSQLA